MNPKRYSLKVEISGERSLNIEIVDDCTTIEQLVQWLEDDQVEGYNPIHGCPMGEDEDWEGVIVHEGRVVARCDILEAPELGAVTSVVLNEPDDLDPSQSTGDRPEVDDGRRRDGHGRLLCDRCDRPAILVIDRDISMLWYDERGKAMEKIMDGEFVARLCRQCAGGDARRIPLAPWEEVAGRRT